MLEHYKKLEAFNARQAMICKSCIIDEARDGGKEQNSSSLVVTCFETEIGEEGSMTITGELSFDMPFLLHNRVLYMT